ncbi:hypothetical protein Acr_00g0082130 [Actinidia rufa]|uniref:RNase H type-1 domain-containing protein n=1 Tax=Actinidia rufa TaxID=165716 RepID=A0A7J0DUU6_9ERIC|nr:hypothetical protein Acr_00g0082130 [Actinidia rufa]
MNPSMNATVTLKRSPLMVDMVKTNFDAVKTKLSSVFEGWMMFVDFVEATIVYRSVRFAWDLEISKYSLEGDSLRFISIIRDPKIVSICDALSSFQYWIVSHVSRSGNQVAHVTLYPLSSTGLFLMSAGVARLVCFEQINCMEIEDSEPYAGPLSAYE